MIIYIFKRILYLIPIIFGITFLTFLLLYTAPSDPITMQYVSMGTTGDSKYIEEQKEKMGFNKPFIIQYLNWTKKALQGDFGFSIKNRTTVKEEIFKRLPKTLSLSGVSLLITIL